MDAGKIVIGTELETKNFEQEIRQVENDLNKLVEAYEKASKVSVDRNGGKMVPNQEMLAKYRVEIEQTTNKLISLKEKQEAINQAKMTGMKEALDGIGSSVSKVIKKVAKWSLALIGVRSVYLGLRQAMSIITSYDEQLKTDVEYMKYALANALKPVIEWIIKAFYKILAIFGYIIKLITGKNIFDNSGVDNFNKDMNKANKSAKDLKKTLTGFDEANVLQDNKDTGTSGGGTPSVDIKVEVDKLNIDEIWQKVDEAQKNARKSLQNYQDDIHNILGKKEIFEQLYQHWATFVRGVSWLWAGMVDKFAGVWDAIVGVFNMVMDIFRGDFDKLGEDFMQFIKGIWEMIKGHFEMVLGRLEAVVGFVIGIFVELVNAIWRDVIEPLTKWFEDVGNKIEKAFGDAWEWVKKKWGEAGNFFKNLGTGMANAFKSALTSVGNFFSDLWNKITNGCRNMVNAIAKILSAIPNGFKAVINFFIDGINKFIRGMNKIQWDVPDWVPFIGGQKWGINIPEIPRLAQGGIVNMPNKGVMVGNAIAGESGREGVIPLTDANAMAQLGQEIGRWVNLAIDNRMIVDGRVLATATNNQINKENFLMNR